MHILLESNLRPPTAGVALFTDWQKVLLQSIHYWDARLFDGGLKWHLYGRKADVRFLLLESSTAEEADRILKQDPVFPHAVHKLDLVCSSEALLEEIRSAVDEESLGKISRDPVPMADKFVPVPRMTYWLAKKELPPLPIGITETEHIKLLCDTAASKYVFDSEVELGDFNAVCRMAGYLLAKGTEKCVREYIARSPLHSHLTLDLTQLTCAEDAIEMLRQPATR